MPELAETAQPAMPKPTTKPSNGKGGTYLFTSETGRELGARGRAAWKAKRMALALGPPPIALPDQIAAHVINLRRQMERIHEKIMCSSDTRALERLVKVQAQLILSEKELLKQAEKPAEVTPPQASDFRPGAVSKSVAAPK